MNSMDRKDQLPPKDHSNRRRKKTVFLRTPKGVLTIVLAVMAVTASCVTSTYQGLFNISVAAAAAALLDYAVLRIQRRKQLVPTGALLTGIIIGLVASPSASSMIVCLAAVIAIVLKHLLTLGKRPIFNPAACGLLAVLWLFSTGEDWWGGLPDLSVWWLPLLLAGGYWTIFRVRKFLLVFTFLGLCFSAYLLIALLGAADVSDMFRVPFINSLLFFSFFMLTDPPTSPSKPWEQVLFATVAACVSIWINLKLGGLSFLLVGLLAANLWHAVITMVKRTSDPSHISRSTKSPDQQHAL
ncbi:RnfABCDGE type electron transport complex subunit D [Paenibacillus filicis]|uniref:RnfABCDGE type electron transport complex subunit D n=1 Tax=Paenibacillus filicis TaxID=669464 RepID=A0ABU9DE80_9BACL